MMECNAIEHARNPKNSQTMTTITAWHSIDIPNIIHLIVILYFTRMVAGVKQARSYASYRVIAIGIAIIIAGAASRNAMCHYLT